MREPDVRVGAAIAAGLLLGSGFALVTLQQRGIEVPHRPPALRRAVVAFTPAVPDLPQSEPSAATPTLVEVADQNIERRVHALASELSKMWTRHPEELVDVIDRAARRVPASPSVTLLLAIAHAETNGDILDVSEAGAVGLAQATPVAIRQEAIEGKLFVTADYLTGARAYIMKKPLGDADTIASLVVDHDNARTRARARRLLRSAMALRREGIDELDLLEPFGSPRYGESVREADAHNRTTLRQLGKLLDRGSRADIRAFRDRTRREYRTLKQIQIASWKAYQQDLASSRDRMLEEHFGEPARMVRRNRPYEAGEYLGEEFDIRFSAKAMASFLVAHLEHKSQEAQRLASSRREVEAMTAALYNGGSHNVKRMLAGLIGSLPETQKYMKKVPATRRRLDATIAVANGASVHTRDSRTQ